MATAFIHPKVARGSRCKQATITAARLHHEAEDRWHTYFLTLTYRPGSEWRSYHVSRLVDCIRRWARRRGFDPRGVWVAEVQEARAAKYQARPEEVIHYHLCVSVPPGIAVPRPDKQGWWPHGSTNRVLARSAIGYMAKYASKGIKVAFALPKGARICGAFGLDADQRDEKAWWMKPKWVRDLFTPEDRVVKIRGGYLSRATGEILVSPWRLSERGPKWSWFEFTDDPPPKLHNV